MRVIPSPTQTPFGSKILSALKPKRLEFCSKGIDESLQGMGSDAWGSLSWPGLRVPTLATTAPNRRYLLLLCSFTVSDGDSCRIVGLRNGWSMGFNRVTNEGGAGEVHRIVEQWVENPMFKGPDFNVTWHLRKLSINEPRRPNPSQVFDPAVGFLQNTAFMTSDTPALLYQTIAGLAGSPFYTDLVGYTPPNAGRPWGRPLAGDFGTFSDLKTRWNDASDWHAVDIPVVGPARVAFYASVWQGDPGSRTLLVVPGGNVTDFPLGLSAEEQFLAKWIIDARSVPIVWRVAGALAVRFEDISPDVSQFRNYEVDGVNE